jgi:hypothetical protein
MNGDAFPKPGHNKNCFFCEYKLRCLSYPIDGAMHDWSIPVEYVSYRDQLPTTPPGLSQAEILAAALADPEFGSILEDLGIAEPQKIEAAKDPETEAILVDLGIADAPKIGEPEIKEHAEKAPDESDLDWWL